MPISQTDFFIAANEGDLNTVKAAVESGQPVDAVEPVTGLTALHFAAGRDNLAMAKYLVAQGAACLPDRSGRWPTTIAAMCEVSGDMCDFIVDEEVKWDIVPPSPRP